MRGACEPSDNGLKLSDSWTLQPVQRLLYLAVSTIRVLIVEPMEPPRIETIPSTLEA